MIDSSDGAVGNQKLPAYDFSIPADAQVAHGSDYMNRIYGVRFDPEIAKRVGWRE